jgi:uncharacterized caspase-like protein
MRQLLYLCGALVAFSVLADTRGIGIVASDGERITTYTDSYALVIGASDYRAGWPDLEGIKSELATVDETLKQLGFKVRTVRDPDETQLRNAFQTFMDDYGYESTNRLLIFYAGHGYTREDGNKGYLVPVDAPNPNIDEISFLRRAYPMTDLIALARNIEASHVLFLFDSCFSGTIFKTRALPDAPPLIDRLTALPVRQFITAGSAGEEVPAKSVFTPALVDALRYGLGDLNHDGYTTGSELGLYLQSQVAKFSAQTPQFGKINDYELSRGDFVFLSSKAPRGVALQLTDRPTVDSAPISVGSFLETLGREREEWDRVLGEMQLAYREIESYAKRADVSAEQVARAWGFFVSQFPDDNPHTMMDDGMRQSGALRANISLGADILSKGDQESAALVPVINLLLN